MIGADGREYSGSLEELRQWAQDGRLGPSTLVWSAVDERWIEASGRHELAWDLPSPPPPAPVRDEGEPSRLRDAGFVPRLLACVADWMIILFLVDLVLLPWQEEIRSLLEQVQVQLDSRGDSLPDLALLVRLQALFAALCTGVSLTYMVGFMGRWGATPGKRMVGLSVVTLEGAARLPGGLPALPGRPAHGPLPRPGLSPDPRPVPPRAARPDLGNPCGVRSQGLNPADLGVLGSMNRNVAET